MKPVYKILLLLVFLAVSAGTGIYWYAFMRPHQNMLKTDPEFELSAEHLFSDYSNDETTANAKYLGKVVEVSGKVVAVKTDENHPAVILEDELFGISAYLDSSFCAANPAVLENVKPGTTITIKGQCDGMLNDVVISRAVIIQD